MLEIIASSIMLGIVITAMTSSIVLVSQLF